MLSVALICAVGGMITCFRETLLQEAIEITGYNHIITTGNRETLNILNTIDIVKDSFVAEGKITVQIAAGVTPQLVKVLVEKNVEINEVYKKHEKLEQRYMELVEGGAR